MHACAHVVKWFIIPSYLVIDCGGLTDPEDGHVTFTPGVVTTIDTGVGAVASYTCDVGYAVVGVASRTCQSDGQFSGQEPVCQGT